MNVLILGAGGPVAAAAIRAMEGRHALRLADIKPLDTSHESHMVDITDAAQVEVAACGMDAIVNLTVIRDDPVAAFDVNVRGAYNTMRAAVANGVRRVVHTGPQSGWHYRHDFEVTEACPMRPRTRLYDLSKYLGQEVCRAFAYQHGLEVACLLFCDFTDPAAGPPSGWELHAFTVSWADSGEAIRCAVEVERLPSPYEVFHIVADLPHRKWLNDKAKALLGWQPRDDFRCWWERSVR